MITKTGSAATGKGADRVDDWQISPAGGWAAKVSPADRTNLRRVVAAPAPVDDELILRAQVAGVTLMAAETVGAALEAAAPQRAKQLDTMLTLMDRVIERAVTRPRWMPTHVDLDAVHQNMRVSRQPPASDETDQAYRRPPGEELIDQIEDLGDLVKPSAGGQGGRVGAVALIGDCGSGRAGRWPGWRLKPQNSPGNSCGRGSRWRR